MWSRVPAAAIGVLLAAGVAVGGGGAANPGSARHPGAATVGEGKRSDQEQGQSTCSPSKPPSGRYVLHSRLQGAGDYYGSGFTTVIVTLEGYFAEW